MLSVIVLNVVMLNVFILNVVVPFKLDPRLEWPARYKHFSLGPFVSYEENEVL